MTRFPLLLECCISFSKMLVFHAIIEIKMKLGYNKFNSVKRNSCFNSHTRSSETVNAPRLSKLKPQKKLSNELKGKKRTYNWDLLIMHIAVS